MTEPLADRIQDIAREIRGPNDEGRLMFNTLYDIGEQIAVLAAERDGLRAEVARLQKECKRMQEILNEIATSPEWEFTGETK